MKQSVESTQNCVRRSTRPLGNSCYFAGSQVFGGAATILMIFAVHSLALPLFNHRHNLWELLSLLSSQFRPQEGERRVGPTGLPSHSPHKSSDPTGTVSWFNGVEK